MINKIDHIGIAVENLEDTLKFYQNVLELNCTGIEEVQSQGVKVAFLPIGDTEIELLEGTNEESTINKYIEKKGQGIHHIALRVDSIDNEIARLKNEGIRLINDTPSYGAGGARVAFIHPKSTGGVLVELCER